MKLVDIAIFLFVFFFISARNVHAYIDPGAGSQLLQILLAGFFALGFGIRTFWARIRSGLKGRCEKSQNGESEGNDNGSNVDG